MSLESLGICEAVALTRDGQVDCVELLEACIGRIDTHDPGIQAWACFNPELVRKQATALDDWRRSGKPVGRLHGVPIGIKDIIDTALIPTEHGSGLFSGRLPRTDAVLVERLRGAGALIMGKTVTAALATLMPGKTSNPHNVAHTPGGSSSGSAAAVASFMAAGAVGTQTNGSVIRPAAFCGTVGYKPSYGLIPRHGVLTQSPFLDQVGVFARSVPDAALLAEVMMGPHSSDPATRSNPVAPPLHRICMDEPPVPPRLAMVRTAIWEQTDAATRAGFNELQESLGTQIEVIELPAVFDAVWDYAHTVNEVEMAYWYGGFLDRGPEYFDETVTGQIQRGRGISGPAYIAAMTQRAALNRHLDDFFDSYDAIVTPSAAGAAPLGLHTTGSPAFCTPWTFCGVPAVTLPLLADDANMPIGVQLVGPTMDDGRLLRTARWLAGYLTSASAAASDADPSPD